MRLLIVENDRAMSALVQQGLQDGQHVVSCALDGSIGLELAKSYQFDVIVLDWVLPEIDGLEVLRHLRTTGNASPILMLMEPDAVSDIVKALDGGADDCLTKPFHFAEFLARLRALSRRPTTRPRTSRLELCDLILDPVTHRVFRGKHEILLSSTEYKLLEFLMRRSGSVASRQAIVEAVWGLEADIEENTLDAFVRLLRSKVDQGHQQRLIHTIRRFGYCIRQAPKPMTRPLLAGLVRSKASYMPSDHRM
jgi:DNA-binding response OmpR family regulator